MKIGGYMTLVMALMTKNISSNIFDLFSSKNCFTENLKIRDLDGNKLLYKLQYNNIIFELFNVSKIKNTSVYIN